MSTPPVHKPSELCCFLRQLGIHPRKGLSQNFLIDGNIVRKIVAAAGLAPGDVVLEIGPGPGALTQVILEWGARVIAVEKDPLLAGALKRLGEDGAPLTVFHDDILRFSFEEHLTLSPPNGKKAKVLANLPYRLTAPILARLVPLHTLFESITVVVQEEVARRAAAEPGTAEYGAFTLFLRFYTHPRYAFGVSRRCSYPVPRVDSAVVRLALHPPPLSGGAVQTFFELTRMAFAHRRKMLRASLSPLFSAHSVEGALEAIGQDPLARPERLSLEEFLKLHALLLT